MNAPAATIHRAIHDSEHPYTPTRRDTAQDTSLSYESAGLLWFLLSKPSDWIIIPQTLVREGYNLRKIMRLFSELISARYMSRDAVRDEKGRITGWTYEVFEEPHPVTKKSTHGQIQPMENPADGFCDPIQNKESVQITDSVQKTTTELPANQESVTGAAEVVVQGEKFHIQIFNPTVPLLPANVPVHLPSKSEPVERDAFGIPLPPVPPRPLSQPPAEDKLLQEQDNPMGRVLSLLEHQDGWGKPALETDCKNAQLALDEYPESWVIHAIKEAKFKGKKFWGFANSCLTNWKQTGQVNTNYDRQKQPAAVPAPAPDYTVSPAYLALSNLIGDAADKWWSERHGQT